MHINSPIVRRESRAPRRLRRGGVARAKASPNLPATAAWIRAPPAKHAGILSTVSASAPERRPGHGPRSAARDRVAGSARVASRGGSARIRCRRSADGGREPARRGVLTDTAAELNESAGMNPASAPRGVVGRVGDGSSRLVTDPTERRRLRSRTRGDRIRSRTASLDRRHQRRRPSPPVRDPRPMQLLMLRRLPPVYRHSPERRLRSVRPPRRSVAGPATDNSAC